jgi:hypothetical protein
MTNEDPADIITGPLKHHQHHDIVGGEFFGVKRGDRIRLNSTKDPFTKVKPGDIGTVEEFWTDDLKGSDGRYVWRMRVKWDKGSSLCLLAGSDKFTKVIDDH